MNAQDLQHKTDGANLLSKPPDCDRLFRAMASWWDGATWAQIADAEGISRQRVGKLLARVGCTRRRWRKADHRRPDSPHGALPKHVADARAALMPPLARRLTVRQRAALAWLAQGLRQSDIARRMVTTPQNVRNLLVAAEARLARLSRPRQQKTARSLRIARGAGAPTPPPLDNDLDWQDLLAELGRR